MSLPLEGHAESSWTTWALVISDASTRSAASSTSGRNGAVGVDQPAPQAHRPRRPRECSTRDGAVFVRAVTDQVGSRSGFNALWTLPETLPPTRRRSSSRTPGSGPRLARRMVLDDGPDPAVAATRLAVREHLADFPPGRTRSRRLLRRPRLGGAGGPRVRGAARRACGPGPVIIDHDSRPGSDDVAAGQSWLFAVTWGLDPSRSCRADVELDRCGLEADARPRYAAIEAVADRLRCHAVDPPRSHPRRPGRAGAARPLAGVRRPFPQPVCRCAAGPLPPPPARPPAHDTRSREASRHRALGRSAQQRPLVRRVAPPAPGPSRVTSGPGFAVALPPPPTCPRGCGLPRALRSGPGPTLPAAWADPVWTSRRSPLPRGDPLRL